MQQQQSNVVKPQKIGGLKKGMQGKKMKKKKPSFDKVASSVRKTMGY